MNFEIGGYNPKDLPKLKPEDERKPEAKYYYEGRTELTDSYLIESIKPDHPIDYKDVWYPQDFSRLLAPNCEAPTVGYCLLPEGVAYSCAVTEMPNITLEMDNWFFQWMMGDSDIRYKIWYPGSHGAHYEDLAIEDFGDGMVDILMGKRPSLKNLGIPKNYTEVNPTLIKIMGRNSRMRLQSEDLNGDKGYSSMVHVVRKRAGGGLTRWSFSYTGAHILNGQLAVKLTPLDHITAETGRQVTSHLLHEYSTMPPSCLAGMKNLKMILSQPKCLHGRKESQKI